MTKKMLSLYQCVHDTHDIPAAGTLNQISYCARCGAAYFDRGPCVPDGREAARRKLPALSA